MQIDFSEDRMDYPGLTVNYLSKCFQDAFQQNLGYIAAKYDGAEFIQKCFEYLAKRDATEAEVKKYEIYITQGVSKESICYELMQQFGRPISMSDATWKLYEQLHEEELDISNILSLDPQTFVSECYKRILGRPADESGYLNYCCLLNQGVPREVIIFMMAGSDEAHNAKRIKNFDSYKIVYDQYLDLQNQAVKEPFIEKLKRPFRTYTREKELEKSLFELQIKSDFRNGIILSYLQHLYDQNQYLIQHITELEKKLNTKGSEQ